jgi:hypothetical protein
MTGRDRDEDVAARFQTFKLQDCRSSGFPSVLIYLEHETATIAALTRSPRPACDALIVKLGAPDQVLASVIHGNPLRDAWMIDLDLPGEMIVTWSGTLAEDGFARHPMTWLKPGHEALEQFISELVPQLAAHRRKLVLRPHSRHVLSDVQSCVKFAIDYAEAPLALALDPAALLEPSMLDAVEDHLTRMFESLGGRCTMIILSDARAADDGDSIELVPLGQGALPRDVIRRLLKEHVPLPTPIVLRPQRLEQQLDWLGA